MKGVILGLCRVWGLRSGFKAYRAKWSFRLNGVFAFRGNSLGLIANI